MEDNPFFVQTNVTNSWFMELLGGNLPRDMVVLVPKQGKAGIVSTKIEGML